MILNYFWVMNSRRDLSHKIIYMQIHTTLCIPFHRDHRAPKMHQGLAKETMETKVRTYDNSIPNHSSPIPFPPTSLPTV